MGVLESMSGSCCYGMYTGRLQDLGTVEDGCISFGVRLKSQSASKSQPHDVGTATPRIS